jgi:hypothetical protein
VGPLVEAGWDPLPAQLWCLFELGRRQPEGALTRQQLTRVGRELQLFEGVEALFGRLEAHARAQPGGARLEFYLLSCGLGDILRATPITRHFRALWANELHYDAAGRALFPRRVLSHTEKTRYLLHIARGAGSEQAREESEQLGRQVPVERLRIPLSQFIYLGDGLTDIPCFSLVEEQHGIGIGVYKESEAARLRQRLERGARPVHVEGMAPADYDRGEDLSDSLHLAVASLCQRIALRKRRSPGELP